MSTRCRAISATVNSPKVPDVSGTYAPPSINRLVPLAPCHRVAHRDRVRDHAQLLRLGERLRQRMRRRSRIDEQAHPGFTSEAPAARSPASAADATARALRSWPRPAPPTAPRRRAHGRACRPAPAPRSGRDAPSPATRRGSRAPLQIRREAVPLPQQQEDFVVSFLGPHWIACSPCRSAWPPHPCRWVPAVTGLRIHPNPRSAFMTVLRICL